MRDSGEGKDPDAASLIRATLAQSGLRSLIYPVDCVVFFESFILET